jgi:hypothetical protein
MHACFKFWASSRLGNVICRAGASKVEAHTKKGARRNAWLLGFIDGPCANRTRDLIFSNIKGMPCQKNYTGSWHRLILVYGKDVSPDQVQFLFIGGIGIVPLFFAWQAITKRPVAGDLPILIQAPSCHKGVPEIDDFHYLSVWQPEIYYMTLPIKGHGGY